MRANFFQSSFGITTFGESHGAALGVVLEDVKANIEFPYDELRSLLNERKPGTAKFSTSRKENDDFQILSGIFEGKTLGTPICIIFPNIDAKSKDYESIKNIFRPSHADFTFFSKFKIYDYRGGGRSSGRETISRVAASAFVNELIKNIDLRFETLQIGSLKSKSNSNTNNRFFWRDDFKRLESYLEDIQREGDSVGGIIQLIIKNIPIGIGDPVFEKLNSNLGKAILSIGAIKGISFGLGFELGKLRGSEANDQWYDKFLTNNAGGVLGGISNGEDLLVNFVVKPTPSISQKQFARNSQGRKETIEIQGRHDCCIIPRVIPVVKSMVKLVLSDAIAYQKLISSDKVDLLDYREALEKIDEDILLAIHRRNQISKKIGNFKKKKDLAITDSKRESSYNKILKEKADLLDLDDGHVKQIWQILFKESKRNQE